MTAVNREDVFQIVNLARKNGGRPDLQNVDLRYVDLRYMDLSNADLRYADLRGAKLSGADLRYADMSYTDLANANLQGVKLQNTYLFKANLQGARLQKADLRYADLRGANLSYANLRDANLEDANLAYAHLTGTNWYCLCVNSTPSVDVFFYPTRGGWRLKFGCWLGTLENLKKIISSDEDWPEALGEEVERRRPVLKAFIELARAHENYHSGAVDRLIRPNVEPERGGDVS
ncbi:pentapeptide repeat-containing protein [Schaalia sp. ZJ405]|uniref:pentapeptide repeat-containing protein n=1 Tax=Schaalia sp. ZJ405 TaxID=2709403 RepID=UPI0013EC2C31|nr:pentapeptide repeat-containing protein [Schaalia sp. ZJ405]QPK81146.1 pentapeptide repeat-containing protein [Schaalia sp. ZJ405]